MPNCIICDKTTEYFYKCDDCNEVHRESILHSSEHDSETVYFFNLGIGSYDPKQSDQTWTDLDSKNLKRVCDLLKTHLSTEKPSDLEEWQLRIDNIETQLKSRK